MCNSACCLVCLKPIEKVVIPIPRTEAYPNLTEMHVVNTHYKCNELFDKQKKLYRELERKRSQLLDVEWSIFQLKDNV